MIHKSAFHIITFVCLISCTSKKDSVKPVNYVIDKDIKTKVNEMIKSEEGVMDMRILENDKEIQNTFGKDQKIPFLITTNSSGGLVSISGRAGMFAGFGFELYIKSDSCGVFFNIATDDPEIYKLNKTDSTYKTGVLVPTINTKVILSKEPDPKGISKGDPLYGYVELESLEFYEKTDNGGDNKFKIFIKAYFKASDINKFR